MSLSAAAFFTTLASSLAWAALDALRKRLATDLSATLLVAVLTLGQLPLLLFWLAAVGGAPLSRGYLTPGALTIGLNVAASLLFIRSVQVSPLSVTVPFLALTPVFSSLFSVWLLSERLTPRQSWGIGLVVAGALLVNFRDGERRSPRGALTALLRERGSLMMAGVALLWSLTAALDKLAMQHASPAVHGVLQTGGVAACLMLALACRGELRGLRRVRRDARWLAFAVVAGAAALGLQLLALQLTLVGIVESIKRAIGMASAVVLGRFVFGEPATTGKLAGIGLMAPRRRADRSIEAPGRIGLGCANLPQQKGPHMKRRAALLPFLVTLAAPASASDADALRTAIEREAAAVMPKVVEWRRDIHQNPELGNREFRTAEKIAAHLTALGLEVTTGVAHTGVVGLLRGGRPGPVVALRSDMDALPVTEEVDLPFRSELKTDWQGRETGVMHACGHDNHMAILMGTAEVLSRVRAQLPGSVKFIFQPAEEGAPPGEEGGAELMVAEGVLADPDVSAIFGLHVFSGIRAGTLAWRPRGIMAAADGLRIRIRGSQTHGALPWRGIDPIVVASQVVLGLQTIVSRQADLTAAPAIVTIGSFQAGNRGNIIPDEALLEGTIRSFDVAMRDRIHEAVRRTATSIAAAAGASAEVEIGPSTPLTYNDPELVAKMEPTLRRVGGQNADPDTPVTTTAEDFSEFQAKVPGVFFFLGVTPEADMANAAPNHSPRFFADEAALPIGVKALAALAADYLLLSAN